MQNDLQYGCNVLCLRYSFNLIRLYQEGLLAVTRGSQSCPKEREAANKPFFMPAWNVGMEAINGIF